jgi:hypothetical protein
MLTFDDWYAEKCRIDALEDVSPNNPEFWDLVESYENDETRKEAAFIRYTMQQGH